MRRLLLPVLILASALAVRSEPDEKAVRYHALLLNKPENPALVARFLDAWLESSDQAALIAFLKQKADSGNAADWRVLAAVHEFTGNDAAAVAALDQAIKLAPDTPAARLARGKMLAKILRIEPALADLTAAAADPQLDLEATTLAGRLLAQSGKPDDALKAWDGLLAKHPDDPGLREDLIDLLLQENLTAQAVESARKLVELTKDPYQNAVRRLRLAEILGLANKPTDAAGEYQAILALSAQDSWLEKETLALAEKLFASGQNQQGYRKFLEQAITAAPTRTALHLALAAHTLASGDIERAIAIHRDLLKSSPDSVPIRQSLASILERAGQTKEAAAELRLLTEQNPADAALWLQLASLCQSIKDQDGLDRAISQSIKLLPADASGRIQSAQIHERFQQTDKARAILEAAAKQDGPHSESADALAQFLARNKETDKAVEIWTEAAKTAPREELLRLSRSLAAQGKTDAAYQVLASRADAFSADPLVLSALCQAALLTDAAASAVPRAIALLDLASTPTETQTAVQIAVSLIRRAQAEEATIRDLANMPKPSVQRLCLLAQLHESLGDSLSATKTLTAAAEGDTSHCALLQKIALLESRGDLPGAIDTLRQLITIPGNRTPAYLRQLVGLQRRAGRTSDAIATTGEWKTLAPGDKTAYLTLSDLQSELGKPADAAAEIRRAIAKFGNDTELREKLSAVLIASGSSAEAYRITLQLHDEADTPAAKLKLVPALSAAATACGREQELEDTFRKRIRENPSATTPILVLRELLNSWNRSTEAVALLEQAARTAPSDTDLQIQYANQLEQNGATDEAGNVLSELARIQPSPDALRRLAAFHLRNGETEKADAITNRLAAEANDPRQLETLALGPFQTADWETALAIIARAKPDVAADWRIAYLKASALEQLDRPDEALPIFLSLLDESRELKLPPTAVGITPSGYNPGRYYPGYQPPAGPSQPLSPEAQALAHLSRAIEAAYPGDPWGNSSRFISKASLRRYGSSNGPIRFNIPATSLELRFRSLVHCFAIACRKPLAERAACLDRVRLPDVPFLPALKRIATMPETETLDSLVAANPTDTRLLSISSSYMFSVLFAEISPGKPTKNNRANPSQNSARLVVKPETYLASAKALVATDPDKALECLSRISASNPKQSETLGPEIERLTLEACRNASAEVIANRAYSLLNYRSGNAAVQKELESLVTAKLPADHPAHERIRTYRDFGGLNEAVAAGRYQEAAATLNRIIAKWKADAAKNPSLSNRWQNYSSRSFNPFGSDEGLTPVPRQQIANQSGYQVWYSAALSSGCEFLGAFRMNTDGNSRPTVPIPPEVVELLDEIAKSQPATSGPRNSSPKSIPDKFEVRDKPAFLAALATVSEPLLQLVILDALDFQPELRAAIANLTKPEAVPATPVLLWSSAWLASRGTDDAPVAYQLAVRAAAAPEPQWSNLARTHLAATALRLDEKARATLDLDPARSALLRLSKSLYNPDQRAMFAKNFKTLGLTDVAAALRKPPSAALAARYSGLSSFRRASNDPAAMVRNGNRTAAARMLLQRISNSTDDYSTRELISQATKLKLTKEIEALRPPDEAPFEKRLAFLTAICRIDDPANHREDLERLHLGNPDSPEALALLCLASEPEHQAELFKSVAAQPDNDLFEFGSRLLKREDSSSSTVADYPKRLAGWKPVIALLDAIPADQSASKNLTWINNSILSLTQSIYLNDSQRQLPGLAEPLPEPRKDDDEEDIRKIREIGKLAEQRVELLRDLTTAMLKHPGTSEQAFQILYAGRKAFGLDDATLAKHAVTALERALPRLLGAGTSDGRYGFSKQQALWARISSGGGASYGSTLSGGISPDAFLASVPASMRPPNLADDLMAVLPDKSAEPVRECYNILKKPEPDAIGKLVAAISEPKESSPTMSDCLSAALWLTDLDGSDTSAACEHLLTKIGPAPLLTGTGQIYDPNTGTYRVNPLSAAATAITTRWIATAPPAEGWKRITKIATDILGPEKHWPAYRFIAGDGNSSYPSSSAMQSAYQKLQAFTTIASGNRQSGRVQNYLGKRLLDAYGIPSQTPDGDSHLSNIFPAAYAERKPDNAEALAASMAAHLRQTALFVPGPGMFSADGSFLPSRCIGVPREPCRTALAKELAAVTGPERFWASVTASFLTKSKPDQVAKLVAPEIPAIRRWPQPQQAAFAEFLITTWPPLESGGLASWIDAATRDIDKALESRLLKALTANASTGGSQQEASLLTLRLIRRAPERAAACWSKAAAAADTRGTSLSNTYSNIVQSLTYGESRSRIPLASALRFVMLTSPDIRISPDRSNYLRYLLDRVFSGGSSEDQLPVPEKWAAVGKGETSKMVGFFAFIKDADLTSNPDLLASMLGGNWTYNLRTDAAKTIDPWADKEIAPHNPLCARVIRCLTASAAMRSPDDKKKAARADAYHALLSHPALPPASALPIITSLVDRDRNACADPRFAAQLIAAIDKADLSKSETVNQAFNTVRNLTPAHFTPEQAATLSTKTIPAVIDANESLGAGYTTSGIRRNLLDISLAMAARSGDKNAITKVFTANKDACSANFKHLTRLALEGLPEIAASLVPPPHEPFILDSCYLYGGGSSGEVVFRFDRKMEEALPPLLAAIKDPQQRYRVESLMHIYHETKDEKLMPSTPRADRIAKLTGRFATEAPPQQQARLEILCAIAPGKDLALADALRTICANLRMGDMIEDRATLRDNTDSAERQRIDYRICALDRLISINLNKGDPEEFFKQASGLTTVTGDETWFATERLRTLLVFFAPRCVTSILHAKPEDKEKWLASVRTLAVEAITGNDDGYGRQYQQHFRTFLVFAHAAAGKGADLVPWLDKQIYLVRSRIKFAPADDTSGPGRHENYYEFWKDMTFEIDGRENSAPLLLTAILTDKDIAAIEISPRYRISDMETSGMFKFDTIKDAINAVPDTCPRKPEYLTELAGILAWRKNDGKTAIATWLAAEEIDARHHASAYSDMTRASRFIYYIDAKQDADAKALLPSIDRGKLNKRTLETFDARAATLKQRAGETPKRKQ
ncbi:MAG: tetratricopeptide repeat protein [Verrucomicrobia bacterium]|nr:tetratricopeptide repeat protein [Verrucomicrobiota bacterium]